MPGFKELFRADMVAGGCPRTGILAAVYYFLTRYDYSAVLFFRLSSTCFAKSGKLNRFLALLFWRLNTIINSCDIRPHAVIGPGLSLPHPVGIVIGYMARIGKNATIYQNVTIGRRSTASTDEDDIRYPVIIGDNVSLYSGCVLMGGTTVGDNADVAANSVLMKDVPPGSLAIGVPARIVSKSTEPMVAGKPALVAVEGGEQGAKDKSSLRDPAAVNREQAAGDVRRASLGQH